MNFEKRYFDCLNRHKDESNLDCLSNCLKPLFSGLISRCTGVNAYSFNGPFFRLRVDPKSKSQKEFDSCPPHEKLGKFGRFDSEDFPVGYFCSSQKTCLLECKEEIEKKDKPEIVIAKLNGKSINPLEKPLKLFLLYSDGIGTSDDWKDVMNFLWSEWIEKDT